MAGGLTLGAVGSVAYYNGLSFDVTLEPVEVSVTPVRDASGRHVIYNKHVVTLSGYVTDANDSGATVLDMRTRLTQIGGNLLLSGLGRGDMDVNVPGGGGVRDVMLGPVPEILSESQRGSLRAWHVQWRVTVCVACEPADTKVEGVLTWTFSVDYRVDEYGQTTRSVTGMVRIPWSKRRVTDRVVDRNVDEWREEVIDRWAIPPGFRRLDKTFSIDASKMEGHFSIVDQQMEWVFSPPPGVIRVNRTHSMATMTSQNFFLLTHSFSGEYHVARHIPKAAVWNYFLDEAVKKWQLIEKANKQKVIPLALDVTNNEDTMVVRCSIRWMVTMGETAKIATLPVPDRLRRVSDAVITSGLFLTPTHSDWRGWANPLVSNVLSSRGSAGLKLQPNDFLVDLCDNGTPIEEDGPVLRGGRPQDELKNDVKLKAFPDPKNTPPRDDSWLMHDEEVVIIEEDDVGTFKLIPRDGDPVKLKSQPRRTDDDRGWESRYEPGEKPDVIIQQRSRPRVIVEVRGKGLRAGYQIDEPVLLEVGGKPATPVNDSDCYFRSRVVGGLIVPLCMASWKKRYVVDSIPTQPIKAPDSVVNGSVSQGNDGLTGTIISK